MKAAYHFQAIPANNKRRGTKPAPRICGSVVIRKTLDSNFTGNHSCELIYRCKDKRQTRHKTRFVMVLYDLSVCCQSPREPNVVTVQECGVTPVGVFNAKIASRPRSAVFLRQHADIAILLRQPLPRSIR